LGIIGVTLFLLVFREPFGFVAMLGTIALSGMIMRNSVILVDQINQDIAAGHDRWTATIDATVRRFRPIVLTALAAILAMLPLSPCVFSGPIAIAIMGGLTVATALTLLFLPALYAAWFRVRPPQHNLSGGHRPPHPAKAPRTGGCRGARPDRRRRTALSVSARYPAHPSRRGPDRRAPPARPPPAPSCPARARHRPPPARPADHRQRHRPSARCSHPGQRRLWYRPLPPPPAPPLPGHCPEQVPLLPRLLSPSC